jgi:hypothetical protein
VRLAVPVADLAVMAFCAMTQTRSARISARKYDKPLSRV